jgi:hypothetical protein
MILQSLIEDRLKSEGLDFEAEQDQLMNKPSRVQTPSDMNYEDYDEEREENEDSAIDDRLQLSTNFMKIRDYPGSPT